MRASATYRVFAECHSKSCRTVSFTRHTVAYTHVLRLERGHKSGPRRNMLMTPAERVHGFTTTFPGLRICETYYNVSFFKIYNNKIVFSNAECHSLQVGTSRRIFNASPSWKIFAPHLFPRSTCYYLGFFDTYSLPPPKPHTSHVHHYRTFYTFPICRHYSYLDLVSFHLFREISTRQRAPLPSFVRLSFLFFLVLEETLIFRFCLVFAYIYLYTYVYMYVFCLIVECHSWYLLIKKRRAFSSALSYFRRRATASGVVYILDSNETGYYTYAGTELFATIKLNLLRAPRLNSKFSSTVVETNSQCTYVHRFQASFMPIHTAPLPSTTTVSKNYSF